MQSTDSGLTEDKLIIATNIREVTENYHIWVRENAYMILIIKKITLILQSISLEYTNL